MAETAYAMGDASDISLDGPRLMSVLVHFVGYLGNNLFQYALGRIVAETNGLALTCTRPSTSSTIPMAPDARSRSLKLEDCATSFADVHMRLPGARVRAPTLSYEIRSASPWRGHRLALERVLSPPGAHVRLRGYFQRYEYYAPYISRIRAWYRLTAVRSAISLSQRDVVVNIRGGSDFSQRGWQLPDSYYAAVLSSMSDIGNVFVCGTGIGAKTVDVLRAWSPIYPAGDSIEQFALMVSAPRLVLSNSTFAWWAAMLSDATEIYAPSTRDPRRYAFTGYRDVDLHPREGRYHEVLVSWPTDAIQ